MRKRLLYIGPSFFLKNRPIWQYAYFPFNLKYVEDTFCYTEAIETKRSFSTSRWKFLADGIYRDEYETDYL